MDAATTALRACRRLSARAGSSVRGVPETTGVADSLVMGTLSAWKGCANRSALREVHSEGPHEVFTGTDLRQVDVLVCAVALADTARPADDGVDTGQLEQAA